MPSDLDEYYAWEVVEVGAYLVWEEKYRRNKTSEEQFAAMAQQRVADDNAGQGGPPVLGKKK